MHGLWWLCMTTTMCTGTAIGINMLSGLPLLQCILLTCLDGVVLLLLMPKLGGKRVEAITVCGAGGGRTACQCSMTVRTRLVVE